MKCSTDKKLFAAKHLVHRKLWRKILLLWLAVFRQAFLFHIKGLWRIIYWELPDAWTVTNLFMISLYFMNRLKIMEWPIDTCFLYMLYIVIFGQKCNLLFISCKWIFNYTYITVHKSMSTLLCNSLWNWSWGNAHIHSWVEGIPASTLAEGFLMNCLYPNTLSSISVFFIKLTFGILVCHIPWYIPCVLQNKTILTGNRSICCCGISAKMLRYFVE